MSEQKKQQIQTAVFHIFNDQHIAKKVSLNVSQSYVTETGLAKGTPTLGTIDVDLVDPRSKDLFELMISPNKTIFCKVEFKFGTKMISEIKLHTASLVGYNLSWFHDGELDISLKFSSPKIEVEGATFSRS